MASAWGSSWGAYWGNTWGLISRARTGAAGPKAKKRSLTLGADEFAVLTGREEELAALRRELEAVQASKSKSSDPWATHALEQMLSLEIKRIVRLKDTESRLKLAQSRESDIVFVMGMMELA